MGRRKKVVEEVKQEEVKQAEAVVEEVVQAEPQPEPEAPKEEIKVEEVKNKKEEMIDIPPVPETFEAKKKEYNINDVIRQYIGSETTRIYEGNLTFNNIVEYSDSKYNVVIGDLDVSKFVNLTSIPKVIFGNLIVNKKANVPTITFLGGKIIKK